MRFLSVLACALMLFALGAAICPPAKAIPCGQIIQFKLDCRGASNSLYWVVAVDQNCTDDVLSIERDCGTGWTTVAEHVNPATSWVDTNPCPGATYRLKLTCTCDTVYSTAKACPDPQPVK